MNPLVHGDLNTYLRHLIEVHIPANPGDGKTDKASLEASHRREKPQETTSTVSQQHP